MLNRISELSWFILIVRCILVGMLWLFGDPVAALFVGDPGPAKVSEGVPSPHVSVYSA